MATAKRKQEEAEGLADGDGSDRDDDDLGVRGNAAKRLRRELQDEELARQWDTRLEEELAGQRTIWRKSSHISERLQDAELLLRNWE